MKRYSQRQPHGSLAELNVTPLLDLAFTLLIIFILASPALEQSVKLNLPTAPARPSTEIDPKSVRTIAVDSSGKIFLDRQPLSPAELRAELAAWYQRDPEASVVLRIDRSAMFQYANDVFDALQAAGISRMAIQNSPEK